MGTNNSTNYKSQKCSQSTNEYSFSSEKPSNKITPEQLLQNANEYIETTKKIVKEINEAQYSIYKMLDLQNRISKQYSIAEDLRYFALFLEKNDYLSSSLSNQVFNPSNQQCTANSILLQKKQKQQSQSQQENKMSYEQKNVQITQIEAIQSFVKIAHSTFVNCQSLILKCSQVIEYIEIIEQREKKIIKEKCLKKQLDNAQIELNDAILILEQYLLYKLQISSVHELDHLQIRLAKIYNHLLQSIQDKEDDSSLHEIPYELY